ncbi:hypothetical protein BC828DRAFT_380289 [Blastocladiella britannica]|nr:hypothetical protein BC828DRAFT_380289 [Blastocladiella britannica]
MSTSTPSTSAAVAGKPGAEKETSTVTTTTTTKRAPQRPDILRPLPLPAIAKRAFRSFLIAFGVKAGIAALLRLLGRLRTGKGSFISIILATTLFNNDAQRVGVMFGLFTALFHASVRAIRSSVTLAALAPRWQAAIAGSVAGLSVMVESPANRLMFTQQLSMRALQATYCSLKARDLFHFPLGDSLLFVVSCMQIMFAYGFYPTSLPSDFLRFMYKTARIPANVLAANATVARGEGTGDLAGLAAWAANRKGSDPIAVAELRALADANPSTLDMLPCCAIHPESSSCAWYCVFLSKHVLRSIGPVYLTLHSVPTLLLRSRQVMDDPLAFLKRILYNTSRSTAFLVVFVSSFQAFVCMLRKANAAGVVGKDHRYWFVLFGFLNSVASIGIEDKKRRAELGLYVAPKAIHSIYQILTDHKGWIPAIPNLDVALCSAAMGAIMSFYAREPHNLSPIITRLMPRFIY